MDSKLISLFLFLFLLNQILSIQQLSKYGSVTVTCSKESRILFDSSGFNLDEEMYFTFTLTVSYNSAHYTRISKKSSSTRPSSYFIDDEINYQFYPNNILNDPDIDTKSCSSSVKKTTGVSSSSGSDTKYNNYYTISKNVDNDYLLIEFDCKGCTACKTGSLKIENTKENKGKQAKIIIIVVVVVFVVVVVVVIVCTYIKRRQRQMAKASMQMAKTGMIMQAAANCYAQPVMGMGMGMASGYGSGYAMNNMPPPPGNMGMQQPIAYSRVGNDVTQLEPNSPGQYIPQSSGHRIKKNKY